MEELDTCLKDLIDFCHNKLQPYMNSDQDMDCINTGIQNFLQEQNFIELVIEILTSSFPRYKDLVEVKEIMNQMSKSKDIDQFETLRMLAAQRKKKSRRKSTRSPSKGISGDGNMDYN